MWVLNECRMADMLVMGRESAVSAFCNYGGSTGVGGMGNDWKMLLPNSSKGLVKVQSAKLLWAMT
jgi:hypothetical protein